MLLLLIVESTQSYACVRTYGHGNSFTILSVELNSNSYSRLRESFLSFMLTYRCMHCELSSPTTKMEGA